MGVINKMRVDGVDYNIEDSTKVSKTYPTTESGKVLGINTEGNVVPVAGGGGGAAVWGGITGTLSNQADLQSALNDKIPRTKYEATEAGKVLAINSSGNVEPTVINSAVWGNITGDISTQTDLQNALGDKVAKKFTGTSVSNKYLKTDTEGNVVLSDGSGTSAQWGDITGTLASQGDLSLALSSKVPKEYGSAAEFKNKVLMTNDEGVVNPVTMPNPSWGDIEGTLSEQTDLDEKFTEINDSIVTKLDSNQGAVYSGKYLKVNADGDIVPSEVVIPSATWGSIDGTISSQTDLNTILNGKLNSGFPTTDEGKALIITSSGTAAPTEITPGFNKITGQPSDNTNLATALNGKINTDAIDDNGSVSTTKLWSSEKLNALFAGISGVVKVEVVPDMPASPTNNTMYYVGTASPYHIYLRADDQTYDMGTTEIDLSNYVKKDAIVDNLTTADTTKPLSANQGKYIGENFLKLSGGTMTGAVNMGSKKITSLATPTDNNDASTKAYVDTKVTSYLPLAGGTMTGDINTNKPLVYTGNDGHIIKSNVDTNCMWLSGASSINTGSYIRLSGKNNINAGTFTLGAVGASGSKTLVGNPNGNLTWNGNNVMTVAGGTYTGNVTHNGQLNVNNNFVSIGTNYKGVNTTGKDRVLLVNGGTTADEGAFLSVAGSSSSDREYGSGRFALSANNGGGRKLLIGDGTGILRWRGKPVVLGTTYGNATDIGNYYMEQGAVAFTPSQTTLTFAYRRYTRIFLTRDTHHVEYICDAWGHLTQLRRGGWSTSDLNVTVDTTANTITIKGSYQWQVVGTIERQVSLTE